jgi:hypothetical protein
MSTNPAQPVSAPLTTSTAPASAPLPTAPVSAPLPIGAITQSTATTLDVVVPPIKQMAGAQLTSTISNMPDESFKKYDMNKHSKSFFPEITEVRTTYSTATVSNNITHLFLVVIAVYIAVKRNGGFNFAGAGPILAAFCCPHIFILYAFYTGFCS